MHLRLNECTNEWMDGVTTTCVMKGSQAQMRPGGVGWMVDGITLFLLAANNKGGHGDGNETRTNTGGVCVPQCGCCWHSLVAMERAGRGGLARWIAGPAAQAWGTMGSQSAGAVGRAKTEAYAQLGGPCRVRKKQRWAISREGNVVIEDVLRTI